MNQPASSFLSRHEFLIRRLHSLSGLIPVGAFLCLHLAVNASVMGGVPTFQSNVDRIHALGPLLPLVEWVFIFIPILFHGVVGVIIVRGGLPNTVHYPYARNWRYTLQRVTGMIAMVFIIAHVAHMHAIAEPLKRFNPEWFAQFDPEMATSSAAEAVQASLLVPAIYSVGVLASVFHLANGIWTMGITWGIWTSPSAQNRANYICVAFGLVLAVVGMAGVAGMMRVDPQQAAAKEERLEYGRKLLRGELDLEQSGADREQGEPLDRATAGSQNRR